jgi:hypothetical protein
MSVHGNHDDGDGDDDGDDDGGGGGGGDDDDGDGGDDGGSPSLPAILLRFSFHSCHLSSLCRPISYLVDATTTKLLLKGIYTSHRLAAWVHITISTFSTKLALSL